MTLVLTQSIYAIGIGRTASFQGVGGTEPYTYSVVPGGAGGTIDASTGVYVAPATMPADPALSSDTVQVDDSAAASATATIAIATPLLLFCDIIQREMGLANGRVYLWDQKIMQPTDSGLYIAVSVPSCRAFGNVNRPVSSDAGLVSQQFVAMQALVDVDIISRGPSARDRKEEVVLALGSDYSEQQQEANSFYIARLPAGSRFLNLSNVDGAAIPYRFRISTQIQYFVAKTSSVKYYDTFQTPSLVTVT